jgi:hypothetical protein
MIRCLLLFSFLVLAFGSQAQYVEGDSASNPKPLQQPALVAPSPNQATPANSTPAPKLLDKFNLGCNFGASFGSFTYIDLSPVVTYQVTPRLFMGPGVTYIYTSYYDQFREKVRDSRYGGRFVARYLVFDNFFLQGEYEAINARFGFLDAQGIYNTKRVWLSNPMAGGGYTQPLGRTGSGLFLGVLYNFNWIQNQAITNSPWIVRVGLSF